MLRIRLDKLFPNLGFLTFRGSPFCGIAYRVEGDLVLENRRVLNGVLGSPAEEWDQAVLRVTFDSLTEIDSDETDEQFPGQGMYFGNVPFCGVAYEFDYDSGCLLREEAFDLEGPGAERAWYPNGQIKLELDRIGQDGHYESEGWYENGRREFLRTMSLSVSYTKEGLLQSLRLEPGYSPSAFDELALRADRWLLLSGRGIDDQIIRRLEGVERLAKLQLRDTLITKRGIQAFSNSRLLERLDTEGNPLLTNDDVQGLIRNLPYCEWIDRDSLLKRLENDSS